MDTRKLMEILSSIVTVRSFDSQRRRTGSGRQWLTLDPPKQTDENDNFFRDRNYKLIGGDR